MSSLPPFVELMASLGLKQAKQALVPDQSPSPPPLPVVGCKNAPTRSSSSPSLREAATRHHLSRYSPYSSAVSLTQRRGSLSSVSSSDLESSPSSATFSIPSRSCPRKARNKRLPVNIYGSATDLAANTPISTYVRRKTPGTSPTSPTFNRPDSGYESSSSLTEMPFSIPSLPVLLPNSPGSKSSPSISSSDSELEDVVQTSFTSRTKRLSKSNSTKCRIVRRPTGIRISAPYPTNLSGPYLRRRSDK